LRPDRAVAAEPRGGEDEAEQGARRDHDPDRLQYRMPELARSANDATVVRLASSSEARVSASASLRSFRWSKKSA